MASYVSLTVTVAGLIILARRFAREPDWRGWAPVTLAAAVLMMAFLAVFGVLIAHDGPGGIFEKLASLTPTIFGIALVGRLIARHDAQITPARSLARRRIDGGANSSSKPAGMR